MNIISFDSITKDYKTGFSKKKPERKDSSLFLILILLALLIYFNVVNGPFILDDILYIADNYKIRDISNFLKDFSGTRYIGFLTFALNYYFGGLSTFGYHLVNIVIHIINAVLVYLLARLTLDIIRKPQAANLSTQDSQPETCNFRDSTLFAFSVSLIFLAHPIQTQAVSYIAQRFTSLATLFYLLSLVAYIKWRAGKEQKTENRRLHAPCSMLYAISIISAILAMKTKEISFTLPFIITLYEFTFFNYELSAMNQPLIETFSKGLRTRLFYLIPFFLTLSIIPITLFWSGDGNVIMPETDAGERIRQLQLRDMGNVPVYNYFITQFRVIFTYMRLLVAPVNQNLLYDYSLSKSIFEPATFICGLFLLLILIFTVHLYIRSLRAGNVRTLLISFGMLWFFITLSIESSIIPIKDVIFEHRVYLPSVGFILSATGALFYGFDYLGKKSGKSLYKYLLTFLAVVIVVLSFSAYKRNIFWSDDYLMWMDNVGKSPNMAEPHLNLGSSFFQLERLEEALKEYTTVLKLNPNNPRAYSNRGNIYAKQGRLDDAANEYLTALKLDSGFPDAHNNLGIIYSKQGRFDEAIKEFKIAISLRPYYADAYNNMGAVYDREGRIDEAIKGYEAALTFDPELVTVHNNLGLAYAKQGRIDKAIEQYLIALKFVPDNALVYNNLGTGYSEQGRFDEAINEYLSAIRIKPDFALAHFNLGNAYLKKGLKDQALKEFEFALKLNSDFIEAHDAIESLKK